LIFQASLPALGFSTYFFEAKSKLFFIILFNKIILSVLANKEIEELKIKITQNDECVLQNEARQ
jgi:hypothetical protein